jgi:hypothetical protein
MCAVLRKTEDFVLIVIERFRVATIVMVIRVTTVHAIISFVILWDWSTFVRFEITRRGTRFHCLLKIMTYDEAILVHRIRLQDHLNVVA